MTTTPADPYATKAVTAALGTVVLVAARWAISGHLNLDDEGVVGLAGALTSLAVYAVSNRKRLLG